MKLFRHHAFRNFKIAEPKESKVLQSKQVMVKDPVSGLARETTVNLWVTEPHIDPHLKGSDFSLAVQLRNGIPLSQCPAYLSPSTPEEYNAIFSNYINVIESMNPVPQKSEIVSKDVNVEPTNNE